MTQKFSLRRNLVVSKEAFASLMRPSGVRAAANWCDDLPATFRPCFDADSLVGQFTQRIHRKVKRPTEEFTKRIHREVNQRLMLSAAKSAESSDQEHV